MGKGKRRRLLKRMLPERGEQAGCHVSTLLTHVAYDGIFRMQAISRVGVVYESYSEKVG